MALSKRLRYEVLRRDNHACRYCGRSAPDVQLTVDHVVPIALGGASEPGNLVAACTECNGGKSSASPDATIVADVSADALRWARAMQEAAQVLLQEHQQRQDLHDQFLARWNDWTYGPLTRKQHLPLDPGWRNSVDTLLAAGLPLEVLCECVDLAMAAKHITADNTFRYMCGIAWKKVAELREIASALLGQEQDPDPWEAAEPLPPQCPEMRCGCGCGALVSSQTPHPPPATVKEELDRVRREPE